MDFSCAKRLEVIDNRTRTDPNSESNFIFSLVLCLLSIMAVRISGWMRFVKKGGGGDEKDEG